VIVGEPEPGSLNEWRPEGTGRARRLALPLLDNTPRSPIVN
jgi:hypothetical protein